MFGKTILQVVAAVVMALIGFLDDNFLDTVEILNATIVGLTAISLYIVPNLRDGSAKVAKLVVSCMTAAFTVLITAVSSGVDMTEWLQVLVAVLFAGGVSVPKAPKYGITGSTIREA